MRYSVLTPQSDPPHWKILDDRGTIVFSGLHHQCEEWLDLADLREATPSQSPKHMADRVTTRLPIFNRAAALLRRFWGDCAGEVRVSGESPAIFLMMVAMIGLLSQFVWPAVVQQASQFNAASAVTYGCRLSGTCAGMHSEGSCSNSRTLDMVCDAADDSY